MEWLAIAGPVLALAGVIFTVAWNARGEKRRAQAADRSADRTDLAVRFDDASELAKYIREEVERQVEIQVAPIRSELKTVKDESHEMNDAVRTRETQLWLWDQRGRQGALPALPSPILTKLGLIALVATNTPLEDTQPTD